MKYFLLFIFYLNSALAEIVPLDTIGLGLESLMGGVGQARLGSNGALSTNPALLAWLPVKKEFFSTNSLNYYRYRAVDADKFDINIDIVPVYAVTTEGLGGWGYGYGLKVDQFKGSFANKLDSINSSGIFELQRISLLAGLGRKFENGLGLGVSFDVQRSNNSSRAEFDGDFGGIEILGSIKTQTSFWNSGVNLGAAYASGDWALGTSARFGLFKFNAHSETDTIQYSEATSSIEKTHDDKIDPIQVIPTYTIGLQRKFTTVRLFVDINYSPKFKDKSTEQEIESSTSIALGLEKALADSDYRLFSGFRLVPNRHIKNGDDEEPAGLLAAGMSKKAKHSLNFGGLQWQRSLNKPGTEAIKLIFGTRFEY